MHKIVGGHQVGVALPLAVWAHWAHEEKNILRIIFEEANAGRGIRSDDGERKITRTRRFSEHSYREH